jgi:Ca2+-binding RTX toxin-like protein
MTIFGLQVSTSINFDGSGEHDGALSIYAGSAADTITGSAGADWFFGGADSDTLTGGAGADTFFYDGLFQSSSTVFDRLIGFDDSVDKIDLPFAVTGFAVAQSGALDSNAFNATLTASFAGLGSHEAAMFTATSGDMAGRLFLVIDADGGGGYQQGFDYVMEMVAPITPIDNPGMFI